jgi:hypothetical protein
MSDKKTRLGVCIASPQMIPTAHRGRLVAPNPDATASGEGSDLAAAKRTRGPETGGQCEKENVVLTAREREVERLDSQRVGQLIEISVERDPSPVDSSADLAGSAEPLEIQEESVGNVDGRSTPSPCQPGTQLDLGLRQ